MTLTQTAILTKQIIVVSIFAIILGIAGFIGYKAWQAYYLANLPPVEEKPDLKFGKLPLPDFPKTNISSSNFSYSLDTITGGLPKVGVDPGFEKNIKIYFVTKSFATLLSPQKAGELAEKFGILTPPQILNEINFKFVDKNKSLKVDLNTGNFTYLMEATASARQTQDNDTRLVSDFKSMLGTLGAIKNDLRAGRSKVILLREQAGDFIPTQIPQEATAAQISLWPGDLDKKTVFTPEFNKSLVNAVVLGSGASLANYSSINFTYYPIDTTTFATYPTKSSEEAFEDLKSGKGAIVVEPEKPEVSITSIYLGYFLTENYNPYLQPIFIFEGPNFVAYVSAIRAEAQSLEVDQGH